MSPKHLRGTKTVLRIKPAAMKVISPSVPEAFKVPCRESGHFWEHCTSVTKPQFELRISAFSSFRQFNGLLHLTFCSWTRRKSFSFILFSWAFPTLSCSDSPSPLAAVPQEAFQIGIYWAHTNTVHKSTALKLVHDLTSPRWKDGPGSEVVTLDEEGYVEADITLGAFPGRQKVRAAAVLQLSSVSPREMHGVLWSSIRKPLAQASTFIATWQIRQTATLI